MDNKNLKKKFPKEKIFITADEPQPSFAHNVYYAARQALRRHASGGNVLIAATVLALVIANIPAVNGYYFDFWNQRREHRAEYCAQYHHDGKTCPNAKIEG